MSLVPQIPLQEVSCHFVRCVSSVSRSFQLRKSDRLLRVRPVQMKTKKVGETSEEAFSDIQEFFSPKHS